MNTSTLINIAQTSFPLPAAASSSSSCLALHKPNHEQKPAEANSPYPTALLPASLRALTHQLAASCRLPEAHLASTGLALLSAAIGTGAALAHGACLTRPNLFFLLLADDSARAAAAFRTASAPLFASYHKFEQTITTETNPGLRLELADLRRRRRALLAEEDFRERNTQLLGVEKEIDSSESFLRRDYLDLVTHIPRGRLLPRLLGQPDGLALFDSDARHAAAAFCAAPGSLAAQDEAALLAGHRGLPILSDRKIKQLHSHQAPCLTALWSLRPADWQALAANPRTATSPLLPKFLIINSAAHSASNSHSHQGAAPHNVAASTAAQPHSPKPTLESLRADLLSAAASSPAQCPAAWSATLATFREWKLAEEPYTCGLSPAAAALLDAYESECLATPNDFGTHHHFPDHAHRLALLLHLADFADPDVESSSDDITPETAARAIALLRWYQAHQAPILETLHQQPDPDLEKITKWLRRAGGQLTLNHLRQHHSFPPRRVEALVEAYPDLLRLDDDPKTTPGRKSQFLTLISTSPISPKSPISPENDEPEGAQPNGSAATGSAGVLGRPLQSAQRPSIEPSITHKEAASRATSSPISPISPQPTTTAAKTTEVPKSALPQTPTELSS